MTMKESTIRYALNVDAWCSKTRVIEPTIDDLVEHVRSELDGREDGDEVVFTVTVKRMTGDELRALPERSGP